MVDHISAIKKIIISVQEKFYSCYFTFYCPSKSILELRNIFFFVQFFIFKSV
jgi:hypothetical protein